MTQTLISFTLSGKAVYSDSTVIGKTFQINVKSLLKNYHFHFGEKAMHQAIKFLLELGYLTLIKNYSVGKSGRFFQLFKPLSPDVVALR